MSDNESNEETSQARVVPCFVLVLRVPGRPDRRLVLDSQEDTFAAAKHDAQWLAGIGSVLISPLLDVRTKT